MQKKFRNVLVILFFVFSFHSVFANKAADTNNIKNIKQENQKFLSLFQKKQKHKNIKRNHSFSKKHDLKNTSSKKIKNLHKKSNGIIDCSIAIVPSEIKVANFDCDLDLMNLEVSMKMLQSKFGYNLSQICLKLNPILKEIDSEMMSGLDITFNELFFEPYMTGLSNMNMVNMSYYYLEKIESFFASICKKDIGEAEEIISGDVLLKCFADELIFDAYIVQNDLENAKKIYDSMEFDDDDFEDICDKLDCAEILLLAYLRNKDFASAEELANSLCSEYDRDFLLAKIVKYYSWGNDTKNALRIIEDMSPYGVREDAMIYVIDSYARQNNLKEIQKIIFSSDYYNLNQRAFFILNIYQKIMGGSKEISDEDFFINDCYFCFEDALKNIVEILLSNNRINDAKILVDRFAPEDLKEDLYVDLVYAYLKSENIDKAKEVRNEILDSLTKWYASKLISIHING